MIPCLLYYIGTHMYMWWFRFSSTFTSHRSHVLTWHWSSSPVFSLSFIFGFIFTLILSLIFVARSWLFRELSKICGVLQKIAFSHGKAQLIEIKHLKIYKHQNYSKSLLFTFIFGLMGLLEAEALLTNSCFTFTTHNI